MSMLTVFHYLSQMMHVINLKNKYLITFALFVDFAIKNDSSKKHIITNNTKYFRASIMFYRNFNQSMTPITVSDSLLSHLFVKPSTLYQSGRSYLLEIQ